MIYFMRAGPDGPVKIGWTKDDETLKTRQTTLQTGQPFQLEVLRTIDTPRWTEAWLHGFFAGIRISGEWFRFDSRMMDLEPPSEKPSVARAGTDVTGNSRQVAVRLPLPLFAEVERIQGQHDRTQTEVVIALIRAGIGVLSASRAPAPANTYAPEQGTER